MKIKRRKSALYNIEMLYKARNLNQKIKQKIKQNKMEQNKKQQDLKY